MSRALFPEESEASLTSGMRDTRARRDAEVFVVDRGAGRLAGFVEARAQGYTEMASDALIANVVSHQAHKAAGYVEMERLVVFRKPLTP